MKKYAIIEALAFAAMTVLTLAMFLAFKNDNKTFSNWKTNSN